MHGELLRKGGKTPFRPVNSDPVKPDRRHQHGEEPGEKVIARDGSRIEQGHNVLRERRGPDQAQPWIELASANNDGDEDGNTCGVAAGSWHKIPPARSATAQSE